MIAALFNNWNAKIFTVDDEPVNTKQIARVFIFEGQELSILETCEWTVYRSVSKLRVFGIGLWHDIRKIQVALLTPSLNAVTEIYCLVLDFSFVESGTRHNVSMLLRADGATMSPNTFRKSFPTCTIACSGCLLSAVLVYAHRDWRCAIQTVLHLCCK